MLKQEKRRLKQMKYRLTAIITPEDDGYVSLCPELDVASQGDTIEEALANLREAVELYLEEENQDKLTN